MSMLIPLLSTLKLQVSIIKAVLHVQFDFKKYACWYLGIAAPTIIGIDWRLDYSIKSKNAGRENVSMFYVSLKVKDRGVISEINMIASIEELQDLLSKVKDAVKQTERVLSSSEA